MWEIPQNINEPSEKWLASTISSSLSLAEKYSVLWWRISLLQWLTSAYLRLKLTQWSVWLFLINTAFSISRWLKTFFFAHLQFLNNISLSFFFLLCPSFPLFLSFFFPCYSLELTGWECYFFWGINCLITFKLNY